jgi:ABC-type histidine transport system ATPase subunit
VIDRFGLDEKRADYPGRLSSGQQQGSQSSGRWPCGRGFMLLDEATSMLDPELEADVLDVIRN